VDPQPNAHIAVLWKRLDGTKCLVARREGTLVLRMERNEQVLQETAVDSPREAMDLAKEWKRLDKPGPKQME
jgi:hypothetical protein